MSQRPDLASLLVARKVTTARRIEAARARTEGALWRALVIAELASADVIFELLRDHAKFPVVPDAILSRNPPIEVLSPILSKDDALRTGLLPLELSADGRRVQIAMVDPTDDLALRSLAQSAGFTSAKVFLVRHDSFVTAVERAYATQRARVEPAGKVGERSEAEASERLEQVLVQASLSLGAALEAELGRGQTLPSPREAARLAREVARELGHDRRRIALAGLAAQLVQLDELRRARGASDDEASLFDDLGWAAGGDDGLLGISRALTAQSAGFQRPQHAGATQRVVQAVIDYLGLAGAQAAQDTAGLDNTVQLLRTSSAGAPVMDALLRVLRRELSERTPAAATVIPEARKTRSESVVTTVRAAPHRRDAREERTQITTLPFPTK